jgi:hypothetical protein
VAEEATSRAGLLRALGADTGSPYSTLFESPGSFS